MNSGTPLYIETVQIISFYGGFFLFLIYFYKLFLGKLFISSVFEFYLFPSPIVEDVYLFSVLRGHSCQSFILMVFLRYKLLTLFSNVNVSLIHYHLHRYLLSAFFILMLLVLFQFLRFKATLTHFQIFTFIC